MKFDAIVGNPPYQQSDAGDSTGASSIYQVFVQTAIKLSPSYISMITPSRWFFGGKGLDKYRKQMLNDKHLSKIVDFTNSLECFTGVDIAGGISYFLRDCNHFGQCVFTNISNGINNTWQRDLNEFDTLIRYPLAIPILKKASNQTQEFLSSVVSTRKPFGLATNVKPIPNGDILLRYSGGTESYSSSKIQTGNELINKWKVIISYLSSEHAGQPDKNGMFRILSTMEILPPGTVCSETYLVAGSFDSHVNAINYQSYLRTKFVRFLIGQVAMSQHITRDSFKFVPTQDFNKPWTDEELYEKYGLNKEEIDFIENTIRLI